MRRLLYHPSLPQPNEGEQMGIDILEGNYVVLNNAHDELVITCPQKNPYVVTEEGLRIQSIFRRVQAKKHGISDGNPFIYALKNKGGFKIRPREVARFAPNFTAVLEKVLVGDPFDFVVPMPSSYGIASFVATRAVKHAGAGAVYDDLLRKKSNAEVLAELNLLKGTLPPKLEKLAMSLRKKLEKAGGTDSFAMKEVDTRLREYIQPLTIVRNPTDSPTRILLVDDLMSSGSTMISARDALQTVFPQAHIEGLCLLSKIKRG